ncbi:MAG: ABC transporter ATP-binding protein [Pseudomonadota bacterium]
MPGIDVFCEDVRKSFAAVEAVAGFTATFAAGQTTALLGPSGCGKSTILRMVAGLEPPDSGRIALGDTDPKAVARRGGLAMAFQDPSLLPWRTVRSNIALGAELAGKPADGVDHLIDLVGLTGFADHRPAELSGGMRQRAAIARSLISDPELLLLDEPFGAVDAMTRRRLNAELPPLWVETGATVILVTHSVEEAVLLSDRILVLSDRPARIVSDILVELPRGSALRDRDAAGFRAVRDSVMRALEETA